MGIRRDSGQLSMRKQAIGTLSYLVLCLHSVPRPNTPLNERSACERPRPRDKSDHKQHRPAREESDSTEHQSRYTTERTQLLRRGP